MVATLDIRDFFPSVDRCRLLRIAEDRFGMEPETAKLFVMLTTRNHRLPQGAPTSPALANLAFAKSDRILSELATDHCLTYTRYVDDLAFSASYDFRALGPRLEAAVRASGFRPNRQKTQFMSKSEDQIVTGLRVNVDLRPTAEWLADLRDLLEHCVRDGPESWDEGRHYDFRRHLGGCVQWLRSVNRELAREYQWLFGQVRWRPEE